MVFTIALLLSYNENIGSMIMPWCSCYTKYQNKKSFKPYIFESRQSYMACLKPNVISNPRIKHKSVPIMIGSYIDVLIRGFENVRESRCVWGCLIFRGQAKIYSSFSTFDSLSLHVRVTNIKKNIEWFLYLNNNGLAIDYTQNNGTYTYNGKTINFLQDDNWVEMINQSNPYNKNAKSFEYIKLFNCLLDAEYDLNELSNRQIINAAHIIGKIIKTTHKKNTNKLSKIFESGAIYSALSKQNAHNTDVWSKKYTQTYSNTLHGGRSDKTKHFLVNVCRATTDSIRNSKVVDFPNDAQGFFCPLATKDLKGAGETNNFAENTILSEDTDDAKLFEYFYKYYFDYGTHEVILNGFIIKKFIDWNLDELIKLKHEFPFVTTKICKNYLMVSTKACVPIKYSTLDCFFSPIETQQHKIEYPDYTMYSSVVKELGYNVTKNLPAKSTVSICNIKGSIAKVCSNFHKDLMNYSLGITCYLQERDYIDKLRDEAIMETDQDLEIYETGKRLIHQELKIDEPIPIEDVEKQKVIDKLISMYSTDAYYKEKSKRNIKLYNRYINLISEQNEIEDNVWDLELYTAFGSVNGSTIEDGLILDEKVVKSMPPITYRACITIDFAFPNKIDEYTTRFIKVKESNCNKDTLIGYVISNKKANFLRNSKHVVISLYTVGNHYYYQINFLPKSHAIYADLDVSYKYVGKNLVIIITGEYQANLNVGSKLANAMGQKNIISAIKDLSNCYGIDSDGNKVHAQVLMSDVSLVGRTASGQMHEMLSSKRCAIGPNKEIIAPIKYIIHSLNPYSFMKISKVKIDTMTNSYGFDTQCLPTVSYVLRKNKIIDGVCDIIGLNNCKLHLNEIENPKGVRIDDTMNLNCNEINKLNEDALINLLDESTNSNEVHIDNTMNINYNISNEVVNPMIN